MSGNWTKLIVGPPAPILIGCAASDYLRSEKALTVIDRISVLAIRIIESSNPLVAEGLFSACRIATTFRAHKNTPMVVPGDHRVSGGGRSDISEGCIGRNVARVARHKRTLEAGAGI